MNEITITADNWRLLLEKGQITFTDLAIALQNQLIPEEVIPPDWWGDLGIAIAEHKAACKGEGNANY